MSIAISRKKGTRKVCTKHSTLIKDYGLEGDAYAGKWHRQVSFLASESIEKAKASGFDVEFGDFAKNIATKGVDWVSLPLGTHVKIGDDVVVEVAQSGKECHRKCAFYYQAGDCIMPREGVFGKVLKGGDVKIDDGIQLIEG